LDGNLRFAAGNTPAGFIADGVFLGIVDLEDESEFRVLMTNIEYIVSNLLNEN
jgi:hypothetical protein